MSVNVMKDLRVVALPLSCSFLLLILVGTRLNIQICSAVSNKSDTIGGSKRVENDVV